MRLFSVLLAGTLILSISGSVGALPVYNIVDLGVAAEGDFAVQGMGVSPGGVGFGRAMGNSGIQAFSWTQAGGMQVLGMTSGRMIYVANGANDSGLVVGTSSTTAWGSNPHPVLWTNGVATELPMVSGETVGRANDVNSAGTIVGSMDGGSTQFASIWKSGSPSAITALTSGGAYMNTAYRINDAGLAVGTGIDPNNLARNVGMLYDSENDTMVEVPALDGDNGTLAFDVSESGYVVGCSSYNQTDSRPFVWDTLHDPVEIPLPDGTSQASARGVNSDGFVVGIGSGLYAVPFLYDGTDTYRLQDLIDSESGWDLSENTSSSALGISESGIIVGTGIINGDTHAYAMIPVPEPCSMLLLLCGGLAVVRRR